MNKIFTTLLLMTLLGCQGNSQNSINLEDMDIEFHPKKFIKPFKKRRDNLNKESDILFDKIFVKKNASRQDTLKYKKIELELLEINSFKTDTLYHIIDEEKVWSDENKKKWAISYNMMSYSNRDSTAYFKNIYFPKVSFVESLEGLFIALSATTNYKKPKPEDFEELYLQLTKKFGQPKKKKIRSFGRDKYSFEWMDNVLVYTMISNTDEYSFDKNNYDIHLYIINKNYNDFVKGKNGTGDWIDLK